MYRCRACDEKLSQTFVDLGVSPLANSYLKAEDVDRMEPFFPLHAYVCDKCFLVQLPVFQTAHDIFSEYAYFSSYSDSWLKHAKDYTEAMVPRLGLDSDSQVIEIASNDGYLLQYFKERNIPVLGIEPAGNVAETAIKAGIPTIVKFLGRRTAEELAGENTHADLLIGNNVLAHVPDLNDFIAGMKILLKGRGVLTMEFPHLLRLMAENQFDTIYHEHFSYFSFTSVNAAFEMGDMRIFDVDELPTHGGSLRIYACHAEDETKQTTPQLLELRYREESLGFTKMEHYLSFGEKVKQTKRSILEFMVNAKNQGRSIAGYGAPAKGNTLLNYCGIRTDFVDYTVDRSPHKQGHYLPGTRIPIFHPDMIRKTKPDYVLLLPWNIKDEIIEQMSHIGEWGGRFVTLIPDVKVF